MTLRELLIQRAARLQEWHALTAPEWGALRYPAFRNRVEGLALGLMAGAPPVGSPLGPPLSPGPGPWGWAAEVACASCGLVWQPGAPGPDPELLGGPRFNDEGGRQAYHDREHDVTEATPFSAGLDHGEMLRRLRRLNGTLGWDHRTVLTLPLDQAATPAGRAALWSALYGGSHAVLGAGVWDPAPFEAFWSE